MQTSESLANVTQTQARLGFSIQDKKLCFKQVGSQKSNLGTGSVIWDAGKVLAKYLERQRVFDRTASKYIKVIELGSGCGIAGISALHLIANSRNSDSDSPFRLVLTDIPKMLPMLEQNLRDNCPSSFPYQINPDIIDDSKALLEVLPLSWEDGIGTLGDNMGDGFDYILGSDVVFKECFVEPLLECIYNLSHTRTTILIAMEIRDEYLYESFQNQMKDKFTFRKIPLKKMHQDYKSEYISIFSLKKKSN